VTNRDWEIIRGLEPDDAAEVTALGIQRLLPAGSVLFELGAEADHLFLVVRGRAARTSPSRYSWRGAPRICSSRSVVPARCWAGRRSSHHTGSP